MATRGNRTEKVKRIFQQFDMNRDGGLNREETASLVVAVNPRVKFSDEQINAILDEVFKTYGDFIDGEKGLTYDGLLRTYDDGAGDVDRDFDALGLELNASDMQRNTELQSTMSRTKVPSLVQLCIKTAIDNLSHIRDVGDTDIHLLNEILNKCNPDQLSQIENASTVRITRDRDLSSMTEALWHQFYIQKFGVESANNLVMMKEQLGVPLNWRQIYEDKSKEWTIIVSTNGTAVVNTTATTPGPGCLNQIKKVYEALLKKLCGIVRCIRSNAGDISVTVIFIFFVLVMVMFGLIGFFTYIVVISFIAANYFKAVGMLFVDVWFMVSIAMFIKTFFR